MSMGTSRTGIMPYASYMTSPLLCTLFRQFSLRLPLCCEGLGVGNTINFCPQLQACSMCMIFHSSHMQPKSLKVPLGIIRRGVHWHGWSPWPLWPQSCWAMEFARFCIMMGASLPNPYGILSSCTSSTWETLHLHHHVWTLPPLPPVHPSTSSISVLHTLGRMLCSLWSGRTSLMA